MSINLQYQLATSDWVDCNDRTEEFLVSCEKFNGVSATGELTQYFRAERLLTRDEVLSFLAAGKKLRNHADGDWFLNCRSKPEIVTKKQVIVDDSNTSNICKICGDNIYECGCK